MPSIQDDFSYSSGSSHNSSSSREALPSWYLDGGRQSTDYYTNQLGSLPTGGYQGDRTAGLSTLQQSGINQGQGYLDASQNLYQQGADMMGQGGNAMTQGYNRLSGAGQYDPNQMQQHMSPYLNGALNTMANLSNRNLMENVMPGVNSTFTGAGQFGSSRNADFMNRAIRDNQEGIQNNAATMLNNAYGQAAQDYQAWGGMDINASNSMINAGSQIGGLGQIAGQYGIQGLNTGMNLGSVQQGANQAELDAQRAQWEDNYRFPNEIYGSLANGYNTSVGRLTNQGSQSSSGSQTNTSYRSQSGVLA